METKEIEMKMAFRATNSFTDHYSDKQTMQSGKLSPEEKDIVKSIFIYSYIH